MLVGNRLVETHIFSFVVGRAFVTDIEKLKISSKTRSLDVAPVLKFFSEVTKVCLSHFFMTFFFPLLFYLFLMFPDISFYAGWNQSWSKFINFSGNPCLWGMLLKFFLCQVTIRSYRIHFTLFTEKYAIVFPSNIYSLC